MEHVQSAARILCVRDTRRECSGTQGARGRNWCLFARVGTQLASHAKMRKNPHKVDKAYRAAVCALPCCARYMSPCSGDVTPHHAKLPGSNGGMGYKPDDYDCIPLCWHHHHEREKMHGPFKGWDKEKKRQWEAENVEATQNALKKRTEP